MMDKGIKILVVDDEADFTQAMAFWFKSKGYTVISAPDGEKAIRMIKEDSPDIVFLDLNMPVMNGFETVKQVRQFSKEIPIIIISAYIDDPRVRELGSYGISGVFYKGADFSEGLSMLEVTLRTHKKLKKE